MHRGHNRTRLYRSSRNWTPLATKTRRSNCPTTTGEESKSADSHVCMYAQQRVVVRRRWNLVWYGERDGRFAKTKSKTYKANQQTEQVHRLVGRHKTHQGLLVGGAFMAAVGTEFHPETHATATYNCTCLPPCFPTSPPSPTALQGGNQKRCVPSLTSITSTPSG